MTNRVSVCVLTGIALFLAASVASAQVAGRLSGSVVDQTGSAVPGATVSLFVGGGKQPVLTSSTNEVGLFSFVAVHPDTYDVVVEAKGFAKEIIHNVKVDPLQETGLPAIKMGVQSTSTSVEVTADVQSVQLTNSEVASTVTSTQVANLPLIGRQVSVLIQTQSGVNPTSGTTSVNGLRSSFTNITLDGINIQDNFIRSNAMDYAPMRTTIDQVDEITVSTSNEGAGIGGGAAQVTLSTKSGSNTYHGSVYWYNRNKALAGNDWFNNAANPHINRPKLDLNQPGLALGGHIIRDKLFFYTNYEWYRNKQQGSVLDTVLTDSARNGIFTYVDSGKNTKTANLLNLRNFTIDPTIKSMIAMLPEPNSTDTGDGLNTLGYRFNAASNEFRDQYVFRGDYYINSKHNLSGTFDYIDNPTARNDVGTFYGANPPVSNTITDYLLSLSWRWTVSSTMTNEARGGFMRADTSFLDSNQYPKSVVAGLLFTNPINTFLNQGRNVYTYNYQDNLTWIRNRHEFSFGGQVQILHVMPWNDAGVIPTYTLGISTAYTNGLTGSDLPGIGSTDLNTANNLYANLAGIISSAAQTFNVTSTTSGFVPGANNTRHLSWSSWAGYAQDKWKVRSNLTVNLGLRYEYWKPLDEDNGLYLAPVLENGNAKATVLDPIATLNYLGGPSGRPFYRSNKHNFAPNVGFAWDPFGKGKTSIRGGYMMAFVNDNLISTFRSNLGNNAGLSSTANLTNLTALLASPPTVTTPAFKVPRTSADNFALSATNTVAMPDPGLVTPTVHQWVLGIQHDYKGNLISVRYVGNHGGNLMRAVDYNQVLYNANGFLADFLRAQNNGNLAVAAGLPYSPVYNPNVAGSQQLTVFPLLSNGGNLSNSTIQTYIKQGQVGELGSQYLTARATGVNFFPNMNAQSALVLTNGGSSTYHGLQTELNHRTHSGNQIQLSYTFSKSLSNTTGDLQTGAEPLLDNNNPSLEYARSPYDVKHSLKANYYYMLPFGKGKRWEGNRYTNAVFGGWAIAGIWSYQSGSPYTILSGWGTLNRAGRSTNTNTATVNGATWSQLEPLTSGVFMTGSGPYFISPKIINTDGRGAAQAGNAPYSGEMFFNPTAGTVGNLQRRMFSGPWAWQWDASMIKSIRFKERHSIDLHFDITNFMNHPTFYVPPTSGDYGTTTGFSVNGTTFGKITSMNYAPRRIQIGAYYRF